MAKPRRVRMIDAGDAGRTEDSFIDEATRAAEAEATPQAAAAVAGMLHESRALDPDSEIEGVIRPAEDGPEGGAFIPDAKPTARPARERDLSGAMGRDDAPMTIRTDGGSELPVAGKAVVSMRDLNRLPPQFEPKPLERDDRDEFTRAIGARFWITEARVEWSRSFDGRQHVYSRRYMREHVLLDVYANDGRDVRREVEEKIAAIAVYNAAHEDAPYGYLPMIRGNVVPPEVLEAVADHQICSLVGGRPIQVVA